MRRNGFLSGEISGGFFWNREPNTGKLFPVIKTSDIARSPEACYSLWKQKECLLIVSNGSLYSNQNANKERC